MERFENIVLSMPMELISASCLCINNISISLSVEYWAKGKSSYYFEKIIWKRNE
jgi:hypothetical protein